MGKVQKHFKVHCSARNHRKTAEMYSDNDLFATWVRLGVLAVERFADRTNDSFYVSDLELMAITGKGRLDVARTLLSRLAHVSPTSASRDGDVWLISIPNFRKKQGFGEIFGRVTSASSSSSSTTTSTKRREEMERAPSAPVADAPSQPAQTRRKSKTSCPDKLEPEARDRIREWAPEHGVDPAQLATEWGAMRDHFRSIGEMRSDWPATFRTWLRRSVRFNARDQVAAGESKAQARERRTREAAAEAFRRMTGHNDEQPTLLALPGGRA